MKPQDVLILLKIFLWRDRAWTQRELADGLEISLAEVNHGLKRLDEAGLYNPVRKRILRHATLEFILYGLRCVFPGKLGAAKVGTPTAHALLANELRIGDSEIYVWPHSGGAARGQALVPLYRSAPQAAAKDPALHKLLALIDVLRVGQAREKNLAKQKLTELLTADG